MICLYCELPFKQVRALCLHLKGSHAVPIQSARVIALAFYHHAKRTGKIKPLFIPLKAKFFDAIKAGTKKAEHRTYGPRWNENTCWPGREIIFSRGYGKKDRLRAWIWSICVNKRYDEEWLEVYGCPGFAISIFFNLERNPDDLECRNARKNQKAALER